MIIIIFNMGLSNTFKYLMYIITHPVEVIEVVNYKSNTGNLLCKSNFQYLIYNLQPLLSIILAHV